MKKIKLMMGLLAVLLLVGCGSETSVNISEPTNVTTGQGSIYSSCEAIATTFANTHEIKVKLGDNLTSEQVALIQSAVEDQWWDDFNGDLERCLKAEGISEFDIYQLMR